VTQARETAPEMRQIRPTPPGGGPGTRFQTGGNPGTPPTGGNPGNPPMGGAPGIPPTDGGSGTTPPLVPVVECGSVPFPVPAAERERRRGPVRMMSDLLWIARYLCAWAALPI
jgi:hypothetical protein